MKWRQVLDRLAAVRLPVWRDPSRRCESHYFVPAGLAGRCECFWCNKVIWEKGP